MLNLLNFDAIHIPFPGMKVMINFQLKILSLKKILFIFLNKETTFECKFRIFGRKFIE
jgi:hypothetical protein